MKLLRITILCVALSNLPLLSQETSTPSAQQPTQSQFTDKIKNALDTIKSYIEKLQNTLKSTGEGMQSLGEKAQEYGKYFGFGTESTQQMPTKP